jgi:hypothetical protein
VSTLTLVTVDTLPARHKPIDDVPNDYQNSKKSGKPKETTKKELFANMRKNKWH